MGVRLLILCLFLCLSATVTAFAQPEPPQGEPLRLDPAEEAWLMRHPVIRVWLHPHHPPFVFYEGGSYRGISIDYLELIGRRLGVEFRPVEDLTFVEALEGLREGAKVDMIPALSRTPAREEFLQMSDTYVSFPVVIVTQAARPVISGLEDLGGETVALEKGYPTGRWLRRDFPTIRLVEFDYTEEALEAVATGRADAYIGNVAAASYIIEKAGFANLKVAAPAPYKEDRIAMGVRDDWPELALLVDKVLATVTPEEERAIRQKWLAVRYEHGLQVGDIVKWTLAVAALGLIWILHLRHAIRTRTAELRREVALRREKESALQGRMEELRDLSQRLSFHIRRMPLGYIAWDLDFRVTEWNPTAAEIFGWSAAEARGRSAHELIVPPEAQPLVDRLWERLKSGEEPNVSENENLRKDGRRIVCEWYNTPLLDREGKVTGVLSMVADITERRRFEEAIQEQFEQISTLFDSINAVVYVADMETRKLLYLNRYGEELYGADWQGRTCHEVLHDMGDKICGGCTNDLLVRDGVPQPPFVWEYQHPRSNRWFQCIDRAIPWPDGRLVRMEFAFDITERKEVEQLKDEMISAVSHEMRTPLTAAMGFTEFLLDNEVEPERQKEYLRTIYQETEKIHEMVNTFLDLQRFRTRREPPSFRFLPLRPHLEEAIAQFRMVSPRHRFTLECPEDLPSVWGDKALLQKVFAHVLSNAVKYSPAGGEIAIRAKREDEGVIVEVRDQGIGIPSDALSKIFDRFYRIDNTDRRMFGGAGLGLALVQEIMQLHDGRVWVESTVGKGSTFYLYLPLGSPEREEEAKA